MADKSSFGQWLKQRRKALSLTQKEIAQQAGCAEVTLRKIEAGDLQPSAPLVASLASGLGVADADLPGLLSLARGTGDDFSVRARLLRPQRANNLPAQLTPLIGRQHDITAVRKRLLADGARLVTLVGPPGVGKTRLALALAEEVLEHFEHGAFFVRLGPVSDPALVPSAIAQALGLEMSGPNPPAVQLRAWLEEKHLLLVLDNFEQIVAAAPLVDDLLRRCPWLHVLVTSRQPLRVRGERQMMVRPLALPVAQPGASRLTGDDALRYAAVALFAERAEAVQPDFAVDDDNAAAVAELCRRLDGLPLAIELVAARVKLLPPAELLVRLHGPWLLSADGLRDVSERQRTLRGAIGWSYDLLSPVEQTLFTRLAVFVGGCTLEAAEMMCEDILSPAQVLDSIASLLDKSLLHREPGLHGEPRYVMLETVREYGLGRVVATSQESSLRERHATCFLRLIETAELPRLDHAFVQVRHLIDDEIHNMRATLAWAMDQDVQAALVLTASLMNWYVARGPFAEGRQLMDHVLELPGASADTIARAKTLLEASYLLHRCNEHAVAQAYVEEALAISQDTGYKIGIAKGLEYLGMFDMHRWSGQGQAYQYHERSAEIYRELDCPADLSTSIVRMAWIEFLRGDYTRARTLAEEGHIVAQQAGLRAPFPLSILGAIAYAEGDVSRARVLQEQRLAIDRQRGEIDTHTLVELVTVATRQGDLVSAHAFLNEVLAKVKGYGNQNDMVLGECYLLSGRLVQAEGDQRQAIQLYRACLVGVRFNRSIWGQCLLYLAGLATELNQTKLTAKLLGAAETVDETIQHLFPIERDDYYRLAAATRSQLGAARFEAAWMQGRAQGFEQAAEEAVSILETALHERHHAP